MKKVKLEKIIAVSGTPGLFKVVSNGTKGVIVENIIDKKRTIVLSNNKIFSLDTIRVYVEVGEKPIEEVMYNLYESLNQQMAPNHKTASDEEVIAVFEKAVPDYDKKRVTISNMRKILQWYNTLHQSNLIEIIEDTENEESENENETTDNVQNNNTSEAESQTTKAAEVNSETEAVISPPKKRGRKKKTENE